MTAKRFKLSPEEAAVILRTNESNVDAMTKRLLQKVVDKRALSEEELGELEGITANHQLALAAKEHVLETGEDTPHALATRKAYKNAERDLAVQARRRMVLELRTQQPPMSIRDIAKRLDCATDTVTKDLQALKENHGKILDSSFTLKILGQTVEQYDILYGKAMALGDHYSSPMAKAAFLRTAISALDSKSKLMGETGIIHRVPERQEILVAHADAGTVRDRVGRLIRAQEQRTSKTIELPPAPAAELMDAELPQEDAPDE
jgi:hypothetical protein